MIWEPEIPTLLSTEETITLARIMRLLYLDFRADYYQLVWTMIFFLSFYMEIFLKKYSWSNDYLLQWKPFENDEKYFLFHFKSSLRSWDIYIFVLTFWLRKKRLDKKTTVSFKIYDVTEWTINNYNTHISKYLKNQRKPDNENCSWKVILWKIIKIVWWRS